MTHKVIKTGFEDLHFEDHIGLQDKHYKVVDKHHESTEELIKEHLPKDFKMEDLEWRANAL